MKASFLPSQHGQIIILFALVLIGLLAFAGLAIDGVMVYSDRRFDQSVADSAALAGAGMGGSSMQINNVNFSNFSCSSMDVTNSDMNKVKDAIIDAAVARASSNGFTISEIESGDHGIRIACTKSGNDRHLDVEVKITSQTQTSLLRIINAQPMQNTVTSVVRVRPPQPAAHGFAIAATDRDNCGQNSGGVWFDGNTSTVLDGGGVYSASCIAKNGSSGTIQVKNSEPGIARTELIKVNFIDADGNEKNPTIDSNANLDIVIPEPDCSGLDTYTSPDYSKDLKPGVYPNGISQTATLEPGLYCIDQDVTSGDISGAGVTLYLRNGSSIKLTGGETLSISAPSNDVPPTSNSMKGLLLYFDTGSFEMTGHSTANLVGTIYAPKGNVSLGGTSDLAGSFTTEIIADHVKIHGNPGSGLQYDANRVYNVPPSLDQQQ